MHFFHQTFLRAAKSRRFRRLRIAAVLAVVAGAALVLAWPLARDNSAQDVPVETPVVTKPGGDYFILRAGPNGEVECRDAELSEIKDLYRGDPGELRQINHLEKTTSYSLVTPMNDLPARLTIILRATPQLHNDFPQAEAAFIAAAAHWESLIKSPITVYIDVDYGPTNFGTPWPGGVLGSTLPAASVNAPYQTVRNNLNIVASNANEANIYANLPSPTLPTDLGDVNTVAVNSAIARAIGLIPPTADPSDSATKIGFNNSIVPYDFDPSNGISANAVDFDAVATHEIGHALGFSSRNGQSSGNPPPPIAPAMWDLFRFRTGTTAGTFPTAQRIMTIGGPSGNSLHFFFAPGLTELGLSNGGPSGSTNNLGDGRQSSHWKQSDACVNNPATAPNLIGIMDPIIGNGCRRAITTNDQVAANIIGYNFESNVAPPPAPTPPPVPPNDNFANAQAVAGCNGSMLGTNVGATKEVGEQSNPVSTGSTRSVWYSWTAPSTGSATIDTNGSDFDTILSVWTGSALGSLTLVPNGSNDDVVSGTIVTSTVTINVTQGVTYRIAVDGFNNSGSGGDSGKIQLNWSGSCAVANTVQLSQSSYSVNESAGSLAITVTRNGNTSAAATVKYATSDATDVNFICNPATGGQVVGAASRKCDYHIASGRLRFGPGEASKVIVLSLVNDVYVESAESLTITLSNSTGAILGTPNTAAVTITDNDSAGQPNPIDGTPFYVRMLYVDLLSREPDAGGFNGWVHRIDFCGQPGEPPPPCDRVTVGGEGFLSSTEFFDREFFVIRLYRTALGRILTYNDVGDLAYVSGFLTDANLELNKQEVVNEIMSRSEFINIYNALGNSAYVDTLIQTAGVTLPAGTRDNWVNQLNGGTRTRAQVFREVSERAEVSARYLHEAQVISCYYGFFTRNPDAAYFNFLQRLDAGQINLGDLANAFINASEYRQRFGP
ncbi:MAG TPA: NF038122 family metalloprotease [Pyrinomonadaceae bacterium]|nr:NF038122 family metalloprotease [Pyrinomonadaceae bacterium]